MRWFARAATSPCWLASSCGIYAGPHRRRIDEDFLFVVNELFVSQWRAESASWWCVAILPQSRCAVASRDKRGSPPREDGVEEGNLGLGD